MVVTSASSSFPSPVPHHSSVANLKCKHLRGTRDIWQCDKKKGWRKLCAHFFGVFGEFIQSMMTKNRSFHECSMFTIKALIMNYFLSSLAISIGCTVWFFPYLARTQPSIKTWIVLGRCLVCQMLLFCPRLWTYVTILFYFNLDSKVN